MKTLTKEQQQLITPTQAINLLKEGNKRFINNLKFNRNLLQQVNETSSGQYPFATILSCIDSRTPAEIIFDQGLGDIFSIRIAGNIINDDILGSMEFSCKIAGSKLILVLGHTKCGAVKGACDNVRLGHLTHLLAKLEPAINAEKTVHGNRNSLNADYVEKVALLNVKLSIQQVTERSTILREMLNENQIVIIGGSYDVDSGQVNFFDKPE